MKHTPGEWRGIEVEGVIDIHADGCVVARVHGDATYLDAIRANGKLIEAAPDMLAALIAANLNLTSKSKGRVSGTMNKIRNAIAKATT